MLRRTRKLADEAGTVHLARELSLFVRTGDVIALRGDLGAGKTTFARALIRSLADGSDDVDVPSPTFTLVQQYEFTRVPVAHFDFYRLKDAEEVYELGFPELAEGAMLIVEWPECVEKLLPDERLEILFEDEKEECGKVVTLSGHRSWADRLKRMETISAFLKTTGYGAFGRTFLQADASTRRYERLTPSDGDVARLILMDSPAMPDGPPIRNGLTYSRIAHIAEDVIAFAAICQELRLAGLSVPEIFATDLDNGLLVVEDLGEQTYRDRALFAKTDMDQLYRAALDVLSRIVDASLPDKVTLPGGRNYQVPAYDRGALEIETELLLDWFWPMVHGAPAPSKVRREFLAIWRNLWPMLEDCKTVWCLRDYHSPNLIWRPELSGLDRVGIIDFQDAVRGHPAYDVASLLNDARLDVSARTQIKMLDYYFSLRESTDPLFDRDRFAECYAILAAQRLSKILGIFARLKIRDAKPEYLQHMPRLWTYLERTLASVEILADLKSWYGSAFPAHIRGL